MVASLIQYAKHKDGTYASLLFNLESKKALDEFTTKKLGFNDSGKVDPSSYHCTIIYSRTPVPDAENYKFPTLVHAHGLAYEIFPTKTGDRCLVLKLNCPEAHQLNSAFNKLGATSDYDVYKPHVTICYNYNGPNDISNLPLPPFDIVFDDYEVKPLDVEFVPANKK